MANLSFNSPLPSLWGIGPYQLVSELLDPAIGSSRGRSSSHGGSGSGSSKGRRVPVAKERISSLEGIMLDLNSKFERFMEEMSRSRRDHEVSNHNLCQTTPLHYYTVAPLHYSTAAPISPPPPHEPYGMFFTSPSPYYASPLVDLYQQQYATPPSSPPEHAHYCYQLSSHQQCHQQWPYSPPPPQQQCQSPSSIGYPPLEIVSSFPAPYQQYPTTPQPYTTPSMCLKQHNQPAPYVLDEMSVREETPDSSGSLCSNQLRGLDGPDIPDIHPHAGGAPGQGLGEHGKVDNSEQSRTRKLGSMGWCRRCKIDCMTMEGLALHSQTREHQNLTMDLVLSIKQNIQSARYKQPSVSSCEPLINGDQFSQVISADIPIVDSCKDLIQVIVENVQTEEHDSKAYILQRDIESQQEMTEMGEVQDIKDIDVDMNASLNEEEYEIVDGDKDDESFGSDRDNKTMKHLDLTQHTTKREFDSASDDSDSHGSGYSSSTDSDYEDSSDYRQEKDGRREAREKEERLNERDVRAYGNYSRITEDHRREDHHSSLNKGDKQKEYFKEVHLTNLASDGKFTNLAELHTSLTNKALWELSNNSGRNHDLFHLFSSMSRLNEVDSFMEDLKTIISQVWGKLSSYSDDMRLESSLRMYALEFMQAITGQNLSSLSDELVTKVEPWEAWENSYFTKNSSMTLSQQAEGSVSIIANALIVLKPSQLVTTISPNVKIIAEDLMTLDFDVSCFLYLSKVSTSLSHLHVLQAVLEKWEVLFSSRRAGHKVTVGVEEMNSWSSDEWDPGIEARLSNAHAMIKASGVGAYNFADSLLEMMIFHLPFPSRTQRYRLENLFEGPFDDFYANAIRNRDPEGPLMLNDPKMILASDEGRLFAFVRVFAGKIFTGSEVQIMGPKNILSQKKVWKSHLLLLWFASKILAHNLTSTLDKEFMVSSMFEKSGSITLNDPFLIFEDEKAYISDYLKGLKEKISLFSTNWVLSDMFKFELEEDSYLKYSCHQKSVLEELMITIWDPGSKVFLL